MRKVRALRRPRRNVRARRTADHVCAAARVRPSTRAGHKVAYYLDPESGRLLYALIIFRDGLNDFDLDDHSHLIIDNTFNTNYWGYKLTGLIGMRSTGRGYTFGLGFMCSETIAAFVWLLTAIVELAGKRPGIIISDGDKALAAAILIVFGAYFAAFLHILCIWHLSKNVFENINHVFSNKSRGKKGGGEGVNAWQVFNRTRVTLTALAQPELQAGARTLCARVRQLCLLLIASLLHLPTHALTRARRRLLAARKAERRADARHV
jgi:hypothetical protein